MKQALTENEVIEVIFSFFEKRGFSISQYCSTNEHGSDIIVESPNGIPYYIEAKGGTSSKETTNRYGKPFDRRQARTHISVAITKCFQTVQKSSRKCIVGIALPKDETHLDIIKSIEQPLKKTKIEICFVNKNGTVEEYL